VSAVTVPEAPNSAPVAVERPVTATTNRGPRLALVTLADLLRLPDPEWLIDGMVEVGAQGVVYGPTGHGKTFVVLDWALCVATGRSWQSRMVKKGPVVYVVTEGGRGIKKRVGAWMQENGVRSVDNAFFVLEAVQLRNPGDYKLFVNRLDGENLKPSLIVFDTFARCFVGGDENTSKDVGEFVDATRRLQEHTGASILAIHHTGKNKNEERGSSALRAAADVMFKVMRSKDGVISVTNEKQKDDEEAPDLNLRLKQVQLTESNGRRITSCVLVGTRRDSLARIVNASEERALSALQDLGGPATSGDWAAAIRMRTVTKTFRHEPFKTGAKH
jgi:hypothetical protein